MTANINPKIITWARERNGLTVEELAASVRKKPEDIRKWESGQTSPSYTSLEDLAYRCFHIPLAVFFFPEPPPIDDPVNKFRRLPDYEFSRLSSDTLQLIRMSQGYQESLGELISVPSERQIFKDLTSNNLGPYELAEKVRKYLGITLGRQFKFTEMDTAFKAWRHAIENAGIFTFKNSFKDKFISGFCLLHQQFPIVVINNSNSFTRQIFTLIHELGHIIYGIHGITDIDETYFNHMDTSEKTLEIKCNQFAGEVLVPSNVFKKEISVFNIVGPEIIHQLAEKYSVSREVILRKFLDFNLVSKEYYEQKSAEWNYEYLRAKGGKQGGDWYYTTLSYLGEGFARLAYENYYQGRLTKEQLAYHLNINAKNLDTLQAYLGW